MQHWTILTCEYPPDCGGVGDYTAQLAAALAAAGDNVTIVCPPAAATAAPSLGARGIEVLVLDDVYGRAGRRAVESSLDASSRATDSPILVQYVPTGFGLRGANIPFCRWLLGRSEGHGNDVRVMFHEPYFEYTWNSIHQNALAAAERVMARTLLRAATRVYLSTDAWRRYLAPHAPQGRDDFETLPIPSAIPRCDSAREVGRRRAELLGSSTALVGHFGTFGSHVAPMLADALIALLTRRRDLSAVCVGAGSDVFVRHLQESHFHLRGRVHGTGRLDAADVAECIAACDLLLQPYPDGVTTRRTSTMAGLINRRPIVTTVGHLTEEVWSETKAVALTAADDPESFVASAVALLDAEGERADLAARGERLYQQRFALSHTVRSLRGAVEGAVA